MAGSGKIVTVKVDGVPVQLSGAGPVGYSTYSISIGEVVLFDNVSEIDAVDPLPVAGVIPETSARVHANVDPETLPVMV